MVNKVKDFVESWLFRAIMVVILPLGTLALIHWTTLDLFPTGVNKPLQDWCLVQIDTNKAPRQASCAVVDPPAATSPAATDQPDTSGKAEKVSPATPKAPPRPNEWQFRAGEADARYGFAIASSITRILAVAASLMALLMLAYPPVRDATSRFRWPWFLAGIAAIAAGGIAGCIELGSPGERLEFVNSIFEQAASLLGPSATTLADVNNTVGHNLIVGYAAVGALLVVLASLAFGTNTDAAARLTRLQIALFFGAALFTSSVAASNALVTWSEVFLDPTMGANAKKLLERLPVYWGVSGSALLIVATGLSYMAIRKDGGPSAGGKGEPILAFRTADDQDFKVLGWLLNVLLALAPAWAALKGVGALPPLPM